MDGYIRVLFWWIKGVLIAIEIGEILWIWRRQSTQKLHFFSQLTSIQHDVCHTMCNTHHNHHSNVALLALPCPRSCGGQKKIADEFFSGFFFFHSRNHTHKKKEYPSNCHCHCHWIEDRGVDRVVVVLSSSSLNSSGTIVYIELCS